MVNKSSKKRIIAYVFGVLILSIIPITITLYKLNNTQKDVVLMNTNIHLDFQGFNAKTTAETMVKRIEEFEQKFSGNIKGSMVYNINIADKDVEVPVDDEFIELYDKSKQLYEMTGGKVDITTMPLTELWGFAPNTYKEDLKHYTPPTQEEIDNARSLVGFDKLILNRQNKTIKKPNKGVKIDFGAVGKGYIADVVRDIAKAKNVKKGILQISSSIYVLGGPYNIAIKDPRDREDNYIGKLKLDNVSIVTSGDYQRAYHGKDGKLYHHIIDPVTGRPVDKGVISASIIGVDSWLADGIATAAILLGYEEILNILQSNNLKAVIVTEEKIFNSKTIYSVNSNFEYNDHDLKDKYTIQKID